MAHAMRTEAVSVNWFRRTARKREREIQQLLSQNADPASWRVWETVLRRDLGVPEWARGVRVERIGPLCWAVIATEKRGH